MEINFANLFNIKNHSRDANKISVRVYRRGIYTNFKNFISMGEITVNDDPFFRFVIAMRYPDGVSEEEGEKWFYDSFIPAMKDQKDLLRGFSYKSIEPKVTPFTRMVELWYRDSKAWIRNWVDGNSKIKEPSWAKDNQNFIYLTPYKEMSCIFLEESPERDFLKQGTAYYTDN